MIGIGIIFFVIVKALLIGAGYRIKQEGERIMSSIQEIKEIENERKEKENDVINEIVNYFNEKFNFICF